MLLFHFSVGGTWCDYWHGHSHLRVVLIWWKYGRHARTPRGTCNTVYDKQPVEWLIYSALLQITRVIWLHANAQTEQTFPSEIEAWMWFPYAYRWNLVKYEATHASSVFDIIWLQSFGKGYLNLTEMEIDIPQRGAKIGLTPRVFQVLIQPSIPRLAHLFICTLGCIHC